MSDYATIDDVTSLGRPLTKAEQDRTTALLPVISARLRMEAKYAGKDLDEMISGDSDLAEIAKQISVDVILRTLATSTTAEPANQITETAGGYSQSYSPLTPGGGLFIKKSELAQLGIRRQQVKNVEII